MIGGFGTRKNHHMRFPKHQECSFCKRTFLTTQELMAHFESFHCNNHLTTYSPSAATTAFRHQPNPNPVFPARNHFDLNYYRSGHLDAQGRFHKGPPPTPAAARTPEQRLNFLFGQQNQPKLIDLYPEPSPENTRTLPLLCQLEQRRPETSVMVNSYGAIDLTLRL